MGIYSPYEVYPAYEIDNSSCENCKHAYGDCWKAGECLKEVE